MNFEKYIAAARRHVPDRCNLSLSELQALVGDGDREAYDIAYDAFLVGFERCMRYERRLRKEGAAQ